MSTIQQGFDRFLPTSPETAFSALRDAVTDGPYKRATVDDFAKSATFRSHASLGNAFTWQAQVTAAPGGATITLSVGVTQTSLGPGALPGKKAAKTAADLFAEVSKRCVQAVA